MNILFFILLVSFLIISGVMEITYSKIKKVLRENGFKPDKFVNLYFKDIKNLKELAEKEQNQCKCIEYKKLVSNWYIYFYVETIMFVTCIVVGILRI